MLWEVGLGQNEKKYSCGAETAEKYRAREAMEKTKTEQVISTILIQCSTLKLKNRAPENFPTLPPQKNSSSLTISNTTSGPARSDSSLSDAELDERYRSTARTPGRKRTSKTSPKSESAVTSKNLLEFFPYSTRLSLQM